MVEARMLTQKSLRDLLTAFASPEPTPGGGSASAVASAVGTSLLLMVAGLPKTRTDSADDRAALVGVTGSLTTLQHQLTEAVDADTAAYNHVVSAYKQPKGTAVDQSARKAAIQRALRSATDVPLGVMRLSVDAAKHAETIARHGHRAASSDLGVALALLQAGLEGARLNVRVNLGGIADAAYAEAVRAESERLSGQISGLVRDVIAAMG
jgi:formiminotetrahydrofolate cyclodeaminase